MRITKIDIPKETSGSDGLGAINMDRIESMILIAGKNGSGKTRILQKIFNTIRTKPNKAQIDNSKKTLPQHRQNMSTHLSSKLSLEEQVAAEDNQIVKEQLSRNLNLEEQQIEYNSQQIKAHEFIVNWKLIETNETGFEYPFVYFVPKTLDLKDSSSHPKGQLISYATNMGVGMNHLQNGTFAKIQVVQDRWFHATHQHSTISPTERDKAVEDYERLQKIVRIFLDTEIGRTLDDEATLFGFPLGKANLSDGQKILIQFCIAIYSQETAMSDLILVLDEPENHLHPSVIIGIIERIKESVTNGQIWIATHSIPLLAHFDPSLIWFVENGKITHAGKIPEKVLHSLLGDDDEISKLQEFIGLPAQLATSIYATESLLEPRAVTTGSSDPQSVQIRTDLLSISSTGKLRILDYGAG